MAIKIMIIEDDLIIAENLKENLIELGYEVTGVAQKYSEAVELYNSIKPDICLVDIYLKGSAKNGIETMTELNAGFQIPIIYLTSFTDLEFREKAKATNPSAYLVKPASKEQIDVSIDLALNNFYKKGLDEEKTGSPYVANLINGPDYFFVKIKNGYEKIHICDIIYLKADGSYCQIFTEQRTYSISANLKSLLIQLNESNIKRCHRSYAVHLDKIDAFNENDLIIKLNSKDIEIPLSDAYKQEIYAALPRIKAN